ncbi:three-helix bundle dimerization domain-containing protein [Streptomyces sp. NBC_00289]|uniref:three-helix bundle dimerization domain-containing protein n=1 Tax=Streptomyces sp. NBC_00289 TaxID=2975703 RepID=UPI00352F5A62
MVARLGAAYPSVASVVVEATVWDAYDSFSRAAVRAYVPILVERRCRRVLGAVRPTAPAQTGDGRAAAGGPEPDTAARTEESAPCRPRPAGVRRHRAARPAAGAAGGRRRRR